MTLPSNVALCDQIIALYDAPENTVDSVAGVVYSVTQVGGYTIINLRGSKTPDDWMRDFDAMPWWDGGADGLGIVHLGMFLGVRALFKVLVTLLPKDAKIIVIGHSLGGARARTLTGLFIRNGIPVELCWTMGSPRPATANLRRIFEKAKAAGLLGASVSFRGNEDPVPLVPFQILLIDWEHTEEWTAIMEPSDPNDFNVLRDHHSARYRLGFVAYDEAHTVTVTTTTTETVSASV